MAPQVRYKPWLTLFAVFYEKNNVKWLNYVHSREREPG